MATHWHSGQRNINDADTKSWFLSEQENARTLLAELDTTNEH